MVIVVGSVVHAMLIDGTMGMVSKAVLCALVMAAAAKVLVDVRLLTDVRRLASGNSRRTRRTAVVDGSSKHDEA